MLVDKPLVAEQTKALLLSMGYKTVSPTPSAQIALASYRIEPIDLALLGISPRVTINDLQLAELLLAHHPAPIILLTSFADGQTSQQAQAVRPAAYLTKPLVEANLQWATTLAIRNF